MHHKLERRLLIYTPLALLCGLAGIWLGVAAAVWSYRAHLLVWGTGDGFPRQCIPQVTGDRTWAYFPV